MNKDNVNNEQSIDNDGQSYTTEQLDGMSEDELNEILATPVTKGEVINLVKNLVAVELDSFQRFIGEPLRVMSMQNLALIELAMDKGLIETESDLQPYFDRVREKMSEENGDAVDNDNNNPEEEKEQQK